MMRTITGVGAGKGPFMSIHDGFIGLSSWAAFLSGSDRIALDTHPYIAFNNQPNTEPVATGLGANAGGTWPAMACAWGAGMNTSQTAFGVSYAGEFSNAINDCGLFVHGVATAATSYGGNCDDWTDSSGWNATVKAGIQAFALASMDALQNWFFWTWKVRGFLNVFLLLFRTGTNGCSVVTRSVTRLRVTLKHLCGPTNSASKTAGCPPILVKPSVHVQQQVLPPSNSTAPILPGKRVERARVR